MSNKVVKTKVILPESLKNESLKVKFCYFALRNFIYYIDKGMHTQMKYNKESHDNIISDLIKNYFTVANDNDCLTDIACAKIKKCFSESKSAIIVKDDFILNVEKELTFKPFAFYCNCMLELSFHVGADYFNDDYIRDTITELSEKTLVGINNDFIDLVVSDMNLILQAIS